MDRKYRKNCASCHGTGLMRDDPIDVEHNGGCPVSSFGISECFCWTNIKQPLKRD
jgi:hypothetical protein